MDVLYFIKEEYAAIRRHIPSLMLDGAKTADPAKQKNLLQSVSLMLRITGELLLPELLDRAKKDGLLLDEAEAQVRELSEIVTSGLKQSRISEARKKELTAAILLHLELMEQKILPLFRAKIITQTREDLGLIALDFKSESGLVKRMAVASV